MYCFGILPYPAEALGYFMEHSKFCEIQSLHIHAIAHPSDPQVFYGPCREILKKQLKELKDIPEKELQEMVDVCKVKHSKLHTELKALPNLEFAAYNEVMQQCEGLPSTSDTNLAPIIKRFQYIQLQSLSIDNFKLGSSCDAFVDFIDKGHMESLSVLWAKSVTSSGEQTTQLAKVVHKMPKLTKLGIQDNIIEHGKTLPTLAKKMTSCSNLQELHISDFDAPAEDMGVVFEELPKLGSLKTLIAVKNHMNDDVAATLPNNLPQTLTSLGISVCDLSRQSHKELLEGLRRLKSLQKLRLYDSPYPSDMVECVGSGLSVWLEMKEFTLIYDDRRR